MKRYISAAAAAAALFAVTGCNSGHSGQVTEVSTDDTSAGITSNYTSQSLQAEPVTTSAATSAVSTAATSVSYSSTSVDSPVILDTHTASPDQTKPSWTKTTTAKTSSKQSSSKTSAGSSNTETTAGSVPTTTTSADVTQSQEPTTRPATSREEIIAAYKGAVSAEIDAMLATEQEMVSVSYTLFDIDGNGIPELIVKSGSDEATLQDTYYTYDDFGLKSITCVPGANTGYAWDPELKKFVSVYYYNGTGELSWLTYDGYNGIDALKSQRIVYGSEDTLEMQLEKNGAEWLPFAKYTNANNEELTWVYGVVSGGFECAEISGKDFSFLDHYEF